VYILGEQNLRQHPFRAKEDGTGMPSARDGNRRGAHPRLREYVQKFNELSAVFDSMPTGVFAILDRELNIATINKAASKILNADSESVIGRNVRDVFECGFPGIRELIEKTIEDHRPVKNFNLEIADRNGEGKTYLVSTAMIEETDSIEPGIILVLHDVSETTRLRKARISMLSYGRLIGAADNMKEVYSLIETVSQYDTTVLVFGETGTGKELVARTIHEQSHRAKGPFIPVSCSALSSSLLESELFGHVKGAFTGAIKDRRGRFELANRGTIFLDEIGTLSLDIQVKLLRTIQERVIEPVGSSRPTPIDVRVISATNRDLSELVAKKDFREDLYYRLKVFQIDLPPLRDRRLDIPHLAEAFIDKFNKLYSRKVIGLSGAAKELLMRYTWPGNVRELENAVEHALVLAPGTIVEPQYLPPEIRHMSENGTSPPPPEQDPGTEEENIRRGLAAFGGNVSRTARHLGMHRTTLWRKMREFGIRREES
jgi:PAS domain S-box-containing protein